MSKKTNDKVEDRYHKKCELCGQVIANSQMKKHLQLHKEKPLMFQPVRAVPKVQPKRERTVRESKVDHKRGKLKVGKQTAVTPAVREEVNRRSMELKGADIPVCERCGSPRMLSKAHIEEASHIGSGRDPRNIMNLCGTHGLKGTCHDWADNDYEGRKWKKQYGAMLHLYYREGNGRHFIGKFLEK